MTTDIALPDAPAERTKTPWYKSMFTWLIVAIIAGIVIGAVWPDFGSGLKPLAVLTRQVGYAVGG
ncbi:hypothetical protein [Gordonia otitidis]|uniref:hypothetical protein n=1 Tax=Gordonia otitidis TaxID=249058 RepID=UPI003C6CCA0A